MLTGHKRCSLWFNYPLCNICLLFHSFYFLLTCAITWCGGQTTRHLPNNNTLQIIWLHPPDILTLSIFLKTGFISLVSIYRFIKKVRGTQLTSSQRIVGLIPWLVDKTNVTDWLVAHFQEFKSFCWGSLRVKIIAVYKNLWEWERWQKKTQHITQEALCAPRMLNYH